MLLAGALSRAIVEAVEVSLNRSVHGRSSVEASDRSSIPVYRELVRCTCFASSSGGGRRRGCLSERAPWPFMAADDGYLPVWFSAAWIHFVH
jgi:hypothetical protein